MKNILLALVLFALTPAAHAQTRVLCTTFPIYQIARNVVADTPGITLDLMLPAALGCPHDYALTPRDMINLARAEVLIINGHGMEEFLGAPVKKANPNLRLLDSSTGISDLLALEADPNAPPYEWAGWFNLPPGRYTWSFAKVDGAYADPAMVLMILPVNADDTPSLHALKDTASARFEQTPENRQSGDTLTPATTPYRLNFDETSDITFFDLYIEHDGSYAVFAEHMPFEFEAYDHFLKDAHGQDVEPIAQMPEASGHAHGHHHHHEGINPHLWVSPNMSAEIALTIARELGVLIPDFAEDLARHAEAYADRMVALLDELRTGVAALSNRRIIQPHGIFDYLARDIGLDIIASTQAHGVEPSAAEMLRLVDLIRTVDVGAIFTEPQYSPKVGQTLAAEANIPWAMLDPVASGPDNAPPDYYETVMRANLAILRATLGGYE